MFYIFAQEGKSKMKPLSILKKAGIKPDEPVLLITAEESRGTYVWNYTLH